MVDLIDTRSRPHPHFDPMDVISAARDTAPAAGLTHNFYRYPARFSPAFAKAVISALSQPGDWVMHSFAGGGTTLVEALYSGGTPWA